MEGMELAGLFRSDTDESLSASCPRFSPPCGIQTQLSRSSSHRNMGVTAKICVKSQFGEYVRKELSWAAVVAALDGSRSQGGNDDDPHPLRRRRRQKIVYCRLRLILARPFRRLCVPTSCAASRGACPSGRFGLTDHPFNAS